VDKKQNLMNFVPTLRSGEWCDIGERPSMEDTHICIGDLAKKFGNNVLSEEAVSFYGVRYLTNYVFPCCHKFQCIPSSVILYLS